MNNGLRNKETQPFLAIYVLKLFMTWSCVWDDNTFRYIAVEYTSKCYMGYISKGFCQDLLDKVINAN